MVGKVTGEEQSIWNVASIDEVCTRVTSGGTPSRRKPEYYEGGVWPWVKTQELKDCWLDDTEEMITEDAVANSSAKVLPKKTVMLAMYGATVGKLGVLRRPMTCNQASCAMIVDEKKADFRFLYYQLLNARPKLISLATGAAQQNLSGTVIKSLKFFFPSVPEQKRIAHILGTLDDKIDLNRRMNVTLEAMAQTLFQSWFVDFDSVRRNAEGGESRPEDSLFPDSFEDSAIGEIPAGWEIMSLYETATYRNGAPFKPADFCSNGDGLPVVKIAELKTGISEQTKWSNKQLGSDQMIDTGDLLYSWSGSPDTSLDAFLWSRGLGLLNQHIFKVITSSDAEKRFVYYLLKHLRPILVETARDKQTTGLGHVTVADMKRLQVCRPQKDVLTAFDRLIAPIFDKAFSNTVENQTLATLRDTLLPKLISGEHSIR